MGEKCKWSGKETWVKRVLGVERRHRVERVQGVERRQEVKKGQGVKKWR